MRSGAAARLLALAEPLLARCSTWTARSWGHRSAGGTRADVAFAAVGQLADLAADAEGQERRPVPRLTDDGALVDQLAVMVYDVARTDDERACLHATEIITQLEHALTG